MFYFADAQETEETTTVTSNTTITGGQETEEEEEEQLDDSVADPDFNPEEVSRTVVTLRIY